MPDPTSFSGNRDVYQPLFNGHLDLELVDALAEQVPFTSVALQRTMCFGTCPVYHMIFHADGRIDYFGKRYVEKIGHYVGDAGVETFARVCCLIEELAIEDLKDQYRVYQTDRASTILRIQRRDGAVKEITDYGEAGPITLWALHQVLDHAANTIRTWEKVSDDTAPAIGVPADPPL